MESRKEEMTWEFLWLLFPVGLMAWVFYRALFGPLCHVHDDDWMIDEK